MKRFVALGAVLALTAALVAGPASAAGTSKANFALSGEARGLELAVLGEGVTLGLALAKVDSNPSALGVGAGQCALLGEDDDPDNLPCTDESTVKSAYPGDPGTNELICAGTLPAPLDAVLTLNAACGSSVSGINKRGVAFTKSAGKVASLSATLPVGLNLVPLNVDVNQVDQIVDALTDSLAPVIDQTPALVKDTLTGATETAKDTTDGATDEAQKVVDGVLEIIQGVDATDALKIELGTSDTKVTQDGDLIGSKSEAFGARIGLIGMPSGLGESGLTLDDADPLKNGLVIIEVGSARASASVDKATADATSAASPALVTVKVRDITSPTPKYVEVSVAPGETITVLEGTPAESTIVAADSTTEQSAGKASAVADAVRLHLLKGVQGGVELAIAGANAAASVDVVKDTPPVQNRPPKTLPLTGGTDLIGLAILLVLAAAGSLVLRRRFDN